MFRRLFGRGTRSAPGSGPTTPPGRSPNEQGEGDCGGGSGQDAQQQREHSMIRSASLPSTASSAQSLRGLPPSLRGALPPSSATLTLRGRRELQRSRTTVNSPTRGFSWRSPLRSLSSIVHAFELNNRTEEQLLAEASVREEILHELTRAVQELVQEEASASPSASSSSKKHEKKAVAAVKVEVVGGEQDDAGVRDLCLAAEQACLHGIKTQEFHGQLPFWDLLQAAAEQDRREDEDPPYTATPHSHPGTPTHSARAARATPDTEEGEQDDTRGRRALRAVVDRVQGNAALTTPVGLARSALRYALHDGTLHLILAHLATQRADTVRRFYGAGALLLHPDDQVLLLDVLRSLSEHYRLDLSRDVAAPFLDEEPDWSLLDLDTTRHRQRVAKEQDRGILASTLLDDLTTWHLEENGEEATLQRFRGGVGHGSGPGIEWQDSFNSSAKRIAQRDPVLDALLESSGVHLKRVGGVSVVVADGNGGEKEEGQPPSEQQPQPPTQEQQQLAPSDSGTTVEKEEPVPPEGSAHARLHRIQQAEAVAAAAAAAITHAPTPTPTPTPTLGVAESELGPAPAYMHATRSLPCSPNGQRLASGCRAGFEGIGGGGKVAIRFHSPSRLSRLGEEGGAPSPPSPEPHQQQQVTQPTAATRDPAVSVEAAPVVLPSAEFLMTPGRRREFKCGARLFGEPLVHLVRDPNTCRLALLDPSLGVPYVFEEMIDFLLEHAPHTPRLFETRVAGWRVMALSKTLDEYQEIPPGTDPHVVAAALTLALRMLAEPILTFERYHSFLAAARLMDPSERHAAIKRLIHDLPLEHKPTLRRLVHMLWRACHPSSAVGPHDAPHSTERHSHDAHTISAPLSARALAPIMTRSLLRSYLPTPRRAPPPPDPPEAVALARALIDEYPLLFHELREEEGRKALALQTKVQRLAAVVEETRLPAAAPGTDGEGDSDPECQRLFRRLFNFLARVERRIHRASHVTASSPPTALLEGMGGVSPPRNKRGGRHGRSRQRREGESPTRANSASPRLRSPSASLDVSRSESGGVEHGKGEEDLEGDSEEEEEGGAEPFSFISPRWETCGFVRGDPGCEMGASGKATLRGIVHFCRRFPCIAAEMLFQYSKHGKRGQTVSFPTLCGQVMRMVLGLLNLLPPAGNAPLSVAAFAGAPHWALLDDAHAVDEVFCVALTLVDFLHYHEALPLTLVEAHLLEAKRQLSWTLAQGPLHVIALWELWLGLRAELRRRYKQQARKQQQASAAERAHAAAEAAEAEGEVEDEDEEVHAATEAGAAGAAGGGMGSPAGKPAALEADPFDPNVAIKAHRGVRTRVIGRPSVLQPWHVLALERALPEMQQDYDWVLLYSLKRHGTSLVSLFERCRGHRYSILCVQDEDGIVFGGFATDEWRNKGDAYYGDGQAFLWSFKGDRLAKYTWTRNNQYFMLANLGGLAMGGGGHFGLMLDGELHRGSSGACATFGSQTLSGAKTFWIVDVEVWGFQSPALYAPPPPLGCLAGRNGSLSGSGEGDLTRSPHRRGSSGSSVSGRQRRAPHRVGLAESLRIGHDYAQQEGDRAV